MSNAANTTQTAAPILTDAAVIDLWAFAVEIGTATREEALSALAADDLSLEAIAQELESIGVRVGDNHDAAHLDGLACLRRDHLREIGGDEATIDRLAEIRTIICALDRM